MADPETPSPEPEVVAAPASEIPDPSTDPGQEHPGPEPVLAVAITAPTKQRWNSPRINTYRIAASYWSFVVSGLNDAAFGPLIPYLETHYHLGYTPVSTVFITPIVGYAVATFSSHRLAYAFGRRGPTTVGPALRIVSYVVAALHPPFPVLAASLVLSGFAGGYQDGAYNSWLGGTLENSSELLGGLHACYGFGALLSPLISTVLVDRGLPWWVYFYVMIGPAVVELAVAAPAFWSQDGKAYRQDQEEAGDAAASEGGTDEEAEAGANRGQVEKKGEKRNETEVKTGEDGKGKKAGPLRLALLTRPSARACWICAAFLFIYTGVEVAYGGWTTSFMLNVRHAGRFASGMSATGFWLGLTVGRLTLGFVVGCLGERLALVIFVPLTLLFELLFFLVPQMLVSAVSVALAGFFLGPMYPAVVVTMTRLLPRFLHITGISFVATVAKFGGCVIPFVVGAIAQSRGVEVLHPIVIAVVAVMFLLWLAVPEEGRTGGQAVGTTLGRAAGLARACFRPRVRK